MIELRPSVEMWNYTKGDITPLGVATFVANRVAGYAISYTAKEILRDLGLITKNGNINKKAKEVMSNYLHEKYHRDRCEIVVINPYTGEPNGV